MPPLLELPTTKIKQKFSFCIKPSPAVHQGWINVHNPLCIQGVTSQKPTSKTKQEPSESPPLCRR